MVPSTSYLRATLVMSRHRAALVAGICVCWAVSVCRGQASHELISALDTRLGGLDRLIVEYDWSEYHLSINNDPFDQSKWASDKTAFTQQYKAWILRPHYRLTFSDSTHGLNIERNWVEETFMAKSRDHDGKWSVHRDRNRWDTTGPIPVITPLELWQVFDIQEGLAELLRQGRIRLEGRSGGRVTLGGDRLYEEPRHWRLRVVLDEDRQLMPLELDAELSVPNGEIHWRMRTLTSALVNGVHAIAEAVLVLSNSAVFPDKWQVYHYKATAISHDGDLTIDGLRLEIPETNVSVLDEIGLSYRKLDSQGRIIDERKWTTEERKADLDGLRAAAALRAQSERDVARRRNMLWLILGASVCCVAAVVGIWKWRSQGFVA